MRLFLLEKTFTTHPLPSFHVRFHPLENKTFFFPPFPRGAELNEVGERILGTVHRSGYGHSGLFGRRLAAFLLFLVCLLSLVHWGGGGGQIGRHGQPLTLWSWYVISSPSSAMYWKSDQMFVCKLEEKDVPELAVPLEKVSDPTPGQTS